MLRYLVDLIVAEAVRLALESAFEWEYEEIVT